METISRPPPAAVSYDLSSPTHTLITLPPASTWTSGLHFHTTHTEYLHVIRGAILARIATKTRILRAGEQVAIERGVRHEWWRAELGAGPGGETVVREWTAPEDGLKRVFFWALNGIVAGMGRDGRAKGATRGVLAGWMVEMRLWALFWELDNWPVFVDLGRWGRVGGMVEGLVSWCVLGLASIVVQGLGWDVVDEDVLPVDVRGAWRAKGKTE